MAFTGSGTGFFAPVMIASFTRITGSNEKALPNIAPMANALGLAFEQWILKVGANIAVNSKAITGITIAPGGPIAIEGPILDFVPKSTSEADLASSINTNTKALVTGTEAQAHNLKYSQALSKAVHNWIKEDGKGAVSTAPSGLTGGGPPSPVTGATSTNTAGGDPVQIPSAIMNISGLYDAKNLQGKIEDEVSGLVSDGGDGIEDGVTETAKVLADAITQWFAGAGAGAVINSATWVGTPAVIPPAIAPSPTTVGLPAWSILPNTATASITS